MTHQRRPVVRRVTYSNGTWTVGAEVPRPNPWRRWIANALTIAAVLACVGLSVWEVVIAMGSMPGIL